jgi:hypothetical protein
MTWRNQKIYGIETDAVIETDLMETEWEEFYLIWMPVKLGIASEPV